MNDLQYCLVNIGLYNKIIDNYFMEYYIIFIFYLLDSFSNYDLTNIYISFSSSSNLVNVNIGTAVIFIKCSVIFCDIILIVLLVKLNNFFIFYLYRMALLCYYLDRDFKKLINKLIPN